MLSLSASRVRHPLIPLLDWAPILARLSAQQSHQAEDLRGPQAVALLKVVVFKAQLQESAGLLDSFRQHQVSTPSVAEVVHHQVREPFPNLLSLRLITRNH